MTDQEYKRSLALLAQLSERLTASLTEQEQELFEDYGNTLEKVIRYESER